MATQPTDVLTSALALPVRERARLAHELLLSLDDADDAGAADAGTTELDQRASEARAGTVKPEDWTAVRARLADRWTSK